MHGIDEHIQKVCAGLNLPSETLADIKEELLAHAEDSIEEKIADGLPESEAYETTLKELGKVEELKNQYRQAYYRQHVLCLVSKLTGLGLFLSIFVCQLNVYSEITSFIEFGALALVFGGATTLLLGTFKTEVVLNALLTPFKLSINESIISQSIAYIVIRTWGTYVLWCGLLCATAGFMVVCANIETPQATGYPMCFGLTGLIYGLIAAGTLWSIAESMSSSPKDATNLPIDPKRKLAALSAFIAMVILIWGKLQSENTNLFIIADISSFVLVVAGSISLSIITSGFKGTLRVLSALVNTRKRTSNEVKKIHRLSIYFPVVGLLGFLTSIVLLLGTAEDTSSFCRGLSVSLIAPLYGLILGLACLFFAGPATRRPESTGNRALWKHVNRRISPA